MKILSDSSKYSRKRLTDAIYGEAYVRDADMVRTGSDALLRALWRSHPDRLIMAEQAGRQVARL